MPDLLFLCHRLPYPPDKGEKIRAWHILKHLARTHRVHLGALADDPMDDAHMGELHRHCFRVGCFPVRRSLQKLRALAALPGGGPLTRAFFYNRALARWVKETLGRYPVDRVYVFCSSMASYAVDRSAAIRVLDLVDVDSEKWRAYASRHYWPIAAIYRREAKTLLALERRSALDFDRTLFVSEAEMRHFTALAPESQGRVGWLENGVDLEHFCPTLSFVSPYSGSGTNIAFVGRMDYWPNIDAVLWFAEEIMPLLRRVHLGVRFHIVGASPTRSVLRLRKTPGIEVTGAVADVRPFLAHADLAVAPLRVARGLQNKVLEAMAMARPVVVTAAALEGLRAVPGRDLLLGTTAEEMASRISAILEGRHPELGAAARVVVERHHDWSENLRRLDVLFPPPTMLRQEPAAVAL
jgi:sugar transferase (PEP-CTERM/EpsH1 system associated)